jgi:hypothetical protein
MNEEKPLPPLWARVAKVVGILVLGAIVLTALVFGTCLLAFSIR